MKMSRLRKASLVILSFAFLATGQANSANASPPIRQASSGQCVISQAPIINLKKPWTTRKKCDRVKRKEYFEVHSVYEYSFVALSKKFRDVDLAVDKNFTAFLKSVNKKAGWQDLTCPPFKDASGVYFCDTTMLYLDRVKRKFMVAQVSVQSFLPGQFSTGRNMLITIEVRNEVWE
jgi:hypothetical protein